MKILLIEDERKLAELMVSGLKQSGYEVTLEVNGTAGLETACTQEFDLILLDLMLPGQNGFEVLKNLKAFKKHTPVIILSALNDTANVMEAWTWERPIT